MSLKDPLQYKISSWRQLPDCLSNTSRDLKIHITDFFNNTALRGFRITVDHTSMGTLFACVLQPRGDIITPGYEYSEHELSVETILEQLKMFGFYIIYEAESHLPGNQLEYLITLDKLGYDKIRILSVWSTDRLTGVKSFENKIVAFQADPLGDWLNNGYAPPVTEFVAALDAGTAINLTDISNTKNYRWDWLKGKVLSIDDIIQENADEMIHSDAPTG